MEYRFTSSPRVPADPALPQTAEEEDAEEDAEESDDSGTWEREHEWEYIRLERERMEYIRTHGLPTDYLVDFTSEQLQRFFSSSNIPGRNGIRELPAAGFKEPPRRPPRRPPGEIRRFKEPPTQAPNKAAPPEAPATLDAPPPAAYKQPPLEVLAKLRAAPPVVPLMINAHPPGALAMSQAPPPPYQTYKARGKTAAMLPKVDQIRRFKEHALILEPQSKPKPVAKPKPVPNADPTGRPPGDPYYGVPCYLVGWPYWYRVSSECECQGGQPCDACTDYGCSACGREDRCGCEPEDQAHAEEVQLLIRLDMEAAWRRTMRAANHV